MNAIQTLNFSTIDDTVDTTEGTKSNSDIKTNSPFLEVIKRQKTKQNFRQTGFKMPLSGHHYLENRMFDRKACPRLVKHVQHSDQLR